MLMRMAPNKHCSASILCGGCSPACGSMLKIVHAASLGVGAKIIVHSRVRPFSRDFARAMRSAMRPTACARLDCGNAIMTAEGDGDAPEPLLIVFHRASSVDNGKRPPPPPSRPRGPGQRRQGRLGCASRYTRRLCQASSRRRGNEWIVIIAASPISDAWDLNLVGLLDGVAVGGRHRSCSLRADYHERHQDRCACTGPHDPFEKNPVPSQRSEVC